MRTILSLLLLLASAVLSGCSGSGAVNPLTPDKAGEAPAGSSKVLEAVYWSAAPVSGSVTDNLNDVVLLSAAEGWACGAKTAILKWDGKTWAKERTGITLQQDLYGISFGDPVEGWAVGERGLVLHYNQGKWVQVEVPTTENLHDVVVLPSKDGWAVGENGTILSLKSGLWAAVTVANFGQSLYAVDASDSGNAWAAGERGSLLRWDGKAWTEQTGGPTSERLRGLDVGSDAEAWAVGAFGTLLRYNGTSWTRMSSPVTGEELYDIRILNGEEGWACGQDGTVLYYDGSKWVRNKPIVNRPALNALALLDSKTAFLVGQGGALLKYQPGGELSKSSLSLEGAVSAGKTKDGKEEWTLTYTLLNSGAQSMPLVTFHLGVPKGFNAFPPPRGRPGAGLRRDGRPGHSDPGPCRREGFDGRGQDVVHPDAGQGVRPALEDEEGPPVGPGQHRRFRGPYPHGRPEARPREKGGAVEPDGLPLVQGRPADRDRRPEPGKRREEERADPDGHPDREGIQTARLEGQGRVEAQVRSGPDGFYADPRTRSAPAAQAMTARSEK